MHGLQSSITYTNEPLILQISHLILTMDTNDPNNKFRLGLSNITDFTRVITTAVEE